MNKQNEEIPDSRGVNEKEVEFPGREVIKKKLCGISMAWFLGFGLGNSNGHNNFVEFPGWRVKLQ